MSLINNGMMTSATPEWGTPQSLFDELDAKYGPFTLDPCATHQNTKVPQNYFVESEDGLSRTWTGRVFMNPPYGRQIIKWIRKAYEEVAQGNVSVAVCLLPARTDTAWWHDYCMKGQVTFIRGRVYFEQEGKNDRAPFPSAIVVFDNMHVKREWPEVPA